MLLTLLFTLLQPQAPAPETKPLPPRVAAANPILPGWYADPEITRFRNRTFWIYPTTSARYADQTYLNAFSSTDLVTWTLHPHVLDIKPADPKRPSAAAWATRALWAPAIVEKDSKYYLFFSANDIQSDTEVGGIGVASSDKPEGPFTDLIGQPLIGAYHNGAQPIDQFVFHDADGAWYLIYGGHGHCNVCRLADDFRSITPLKDGTLYKEITPEHYVEGPCMLRHGGTYYLMWSEGGWTGPDYRVAYATGATVTGPFTRVGVILQQDAAIATGAGHHSVVEVPRKEASTANTEPDYYICYHRRPLGETDANHRVVCLDRMTFDKEGHITPVTMTGR